MSFEWTPERPLVYDTTVRLTVLDMEGNKIRLRDLSPHKDWPQHRCSASPQRTVWVERRGLRL